MPPRSDRLIAEAPRKVSRAEMLLAKCLGSSSWDPLIQAGLRSSVLRCPRPAESGRECGGLGHWRTAWPNDRVRDERRAPDAADSDGEVWRSIADVWECNRCGHLTRNPRIGFIGSMADCSWRGKGRLGSSANVVEINLTYLMTEIRTDIFYDFENALIAACDDERTGGRNGGQSQEKQEARQASANRSGGGHRPNLVCQRGKDR